MTKKNPIPSSAERPQIPPSVSRRQILRGLAVAAGAGAAWPYIAGSHPIYKHLCDAETLARADAATSAQDWTPQFLTPQQSETLRVLSEAVVPGSAQAQSHRFIDLLLSVDRAENQQNFVTALRAIETESVARFGKPFHALDSNEQTLLLTAAATMDGLRKDATGDVVRNPPGNLRDHFDLLKGWISGAYYSSAIGMAELGWTDDRVFAQFPDCAHADEHN